MKFRAFLCLACLGAGLVSCEKESETVTVPTGPEVPAPADIREAVETPEVDIPELSAEERIGKVPALGLVPADADFFLALQNFSFISESIIGQLSENDDKTLESLLFLTNITEAVEGAFLAMTSPPEHVPGSLVELSELSNVFNGLGWSPLVLEYGQAEMFQIFVESNEDRIVRFLEGLDLTSLTVGLHLPDPETRDVYLAQSIGGLGMAQMFNSEVELLRPVERTIDGVLFQGLTVSGEDIVENFGNYLRAEMLSELPPRVVSAAMDAIQRNSLCLLIGAKDDHLIYHVGPSVNDLTFPTQVNRSLASHQRSSWLDQAQEAAVVAFSHEGDQAFSADGAVSSGYGSLAEGLRLAIRTVPGTTDTIGLDALLQKFISEEKRILTERTVNPLNLVGYLDKGLTITAKGGPQFGSVKEGKVSELEDKDSVVLMSAAFDKEQLNQSIEFQSLMVATVYEAINQFSAGPKGSLLMGSGLPISAVNSLALVAPLAELPDGFIEHVYPALGGSLNVRIQSPVEEVPDGLWKGSFTANVVDLELLKTGWTKFDAEMVTALEKISADEVVIERKETSSGSETISYAHSNGTLLATVHLTPEVFQVHFGGEDLVPVSQTQAGVVMKISTEQLVQFLPEVEDPEENKDDAEEDDLSDFGLSSPPASGLTPEQRKLLERLINELETIDYTLERRNGMMHAKFEIRQKE